MCSGTVSSLGHVDVKIILIAYAGPPKVSVQVLRYQGLRAAELNGLSDPYVLMELVDAGKAREEQENENEEENVGSRFRREI